MIVNIIAVSISIIALALAIWSYWMVITLKKNIRGVFQSDKIQNADELLESYSQKFQSIETQLARGFTQQDFHSTILHYTLHKVAMKRFNPFADMGGDTSFAIALLNNENTGLILTHIATRDSGGGRSYAKPIQKGKSSQTLSEEELSVLNTAINTPFTHKL
jgi:hypothetical protein